MQKLNQKLNFFQIKVKIFSPFHRVVDEYINTKKTTCDLNFDFLKTLKQHGYWINIKHRSQEKLSIKKASL